MRYCTLPTGNEVAIRAHERRGPRSARWWLGRVSGCDRLRGRGWHGRGAVRQLARRLPDGGGGRSRATFAATAPTRVLLVDAIEEDALLVRDLLARAQYGEYLLEHATDAQDGLAKLLSGGHDVALIEHGLKGEGCLSFARAVGRRGLATPLIVLSEGSAPGLDLAAIDAGAADYLDKEELAVERLERAIRIALARQRRNARLDTPAQIDPLTGLVSRHAYLDRLEQALGRARRRRDRAAVMLVDIDRFDAVNHRFGHGAGDSLLGSSAIGFGASCATPTPRRGSMAIASP